jgi:hypothetical protein
MPRRCIAFSPKRERFQIWTRCPTRAQPGDIYCRRHRDALIGAVIGLHNAYTNKNPRDFTWYFPLPGDRGVRPSGECCALHRQLLEENARLAEQGAKGPQSPRNEEAIHEAEVCGEARAGEQARDSRQDEQGSDSSDLARAAQHEAAGPSVDT